MGFGLIEDEASITLISEIGLILLLFILGLEIDLKELLTSGRTLIVSGISQFLISVALGIGFFLLIGFQIGNGRFDALYLAIAMALSSTMIVVKILHDKSKLITPPGSIHWVYSYSMTYGPFYSSPSSLISRTLALTIMLSFIKGTALVLLSFLVSRYLLLRVFSFTAKVPELLLIKVIAWCALKPALHGRSGWQGKWVPLLRV
jgi:Kef-type K+ transport system membrane component KefB